MLIGRLLTNADSSGGFTPDTSPWSLPDGETVDIGSGGSWASLGIRFNHLSSKGTLQYFTAAAGIADWPGTVYHEDEPSAVFTGSDFEVWASQTAGNLTLDASSALDTWLDLSLQRDFSRENGGVAGTYTATLRLKIRDAGTLEILADGEITITGEKT